MQPTKGSKSAHFVCERALIGQTQPITCLAFSLTGNLLASGSKDCSVVLWVPLTGVMKHHLLLPSTVISLAWSSECQLSPLITSRSVEFWSDLCHQFLFLILLVTGAYSGHLVLSGIKAIVSAIVVDQNTGHIAFGVGSELHMAHAIESGFYCLSYLALQCSPWCFCRYMPHSRYSHHQMGFRAPHLEQMKEYRSGLLVLVTRDPN